MKKSTGEDALFALGKAMNLAKGTVLHNTNDECKALGKVLSGKLRLSRILSSGKEIVIKEFSPGELYAELVVFTGRNYPGWLIASEESRVVEVSYPRLLEYLDDREAMVSFISGISKKLIHLTDTIEIMSLKTVEEKIAFFLLTPGELEKTERTRFTVTGFAEQLGCSREAVSRALSKMEDSGIITREEGRIRIKDKPLLEGIF